MVLPVDGFRSCRRPEKARRLRVALGIRLLGERLVPMGRVRFALEGRVEVVEGLLRDFRLCGNNRRDEHGADQ